MDLVGPDCSSPWRPRKHKQEHDLVALGRALSKVSHLRFGRLVPDGDASPPALDAAAGAAGGGGGGGAGVGFAAGLLMGNNVAGAAGGGGENLLADLANVVDGLIQNMQGMDIPEHLQRVIERFEMVSRALEWSLLG